MGETSTAGDMPGLATPTDLKEAWLVSVLEHAPLYQLPKVIDLPFASAY